MNYNSIFKGVFLSFFIVSFIFFNHSPVSADCTIEETPTGYSIICSDPISGEIWGTDQQDIIHILPHTSLLYYFTDSGDNLTEAMVVGIYGLQGNDEITNEGDIEELLARAETTAVGVSLTIDGTLNGDSSGAALSDSSATADASATGIDGGAGNDTIDNQATISADAQAVVTATDVATDITVTLDGNASGGALSDTSVTANAAATGIEGGGDTDFIYNRGDIVLNAETDATGVAVSLDVAGTMEGNAEGSSVSDASVMATSRATGIDGGAGNDTITSDGSHMTVGADANATAVSVGLTVSGSMEGNVQGEALSDGSATANAVATGIHGGLGQDGIENWSIIYGDVDASATSVAAAVDVAISIDEGGNATGAALSDASVTANAAARGIDGGGNGDTIDNRGDMELLANSDATGVAVSLDVAGTMKGDAEGSSVSDASVTATSQATGIEGGEGDDTIENEGEISLMNGIGDDETDASATAVSVGLTVSGSMEGNVAGEAMSDSSATAGAMAIGINGGSGIDTITNRGTIVGNVDSRATAVGIALDIGITEEGNASGGALSDASVTADAAASGIDAGGDGDIIDNRGNIDLSADSNATGVAVALDIAGTMKGDAEGSSVSDASVMATSTATGIDGGAGNDTITSDGSHMTVGADANATAVSVGLTVSGSMEGNTDGSALSDGSATADAVATGIHGGLGQDTIDNWSIIYEDVDASATTVAAAVDVAVSIDEGGNATGGALSDASVTANAAARGIDGGEDIDTIDNRGDIELLANSDATGVAVSLDVAGTMKGDAEGSSVSDASVTATSRATGIEGGEGDDTIDNEGVITLMNGIGDDETDATATAVSVSLTVSGSMEGNVAGEALSDSSAMSDAMAIGINGGSGIDTITNRGAIVGDVDSSATAIGVGLNVSIIAAQDGDAEGNVSGAAISDASVTAASTATGIYGDKNVDIIDNRGGIDLSAFSEATGVAASLDVAGSVSSKGDVEGEIGGKALSNSSSEAYTETTGIDGGEDGDHIINTGDFSLLQAKSIATGVSASLNISTGFAANGDTKVNVEGEAVSDTSVAAEAMALGLDGGLDDDEIDNKGDFRLLSIADATGVAASLDITGALSYKGSSTSDVSGSAVSDSSVFARAEATGIEGGWGQDTIRNSGNITVMDEDIFDADALGVSASLNVSGNVAIKGVAVGTVEGAAASNATVTAEASATGIDGGENNDIIDNTGAIKLLPSSNADGIAASLNVSGGMIGETGGSAGSDASVTAMSMATGIDGGEGNDTIDNEGMITLMKQDEVDDEVDAKALGVAASLDISGTLDGTAEGQAISKATTTAEAAATGISGGGGQDTIANRAAISADVDSDAEGVAVAADVTVTVNGQADGSSLSDVSSEATAEAFGIDGGEDDDIIDNEGYIQLSTDSEATSTAVSVAVGGSLRGTAEGEALSTATTTAEACATGIEGGGGQDVINNRSTISADATSDAIATAVSADVTFTGLGNAEGAALSDVSALSFASASGIDGGQGNDMLSNEGDLLLRSESDSDATAVSVSLTASMKGVAKGMAMADASSLAVSESAGIRGEEGADDIDNGANLDDGMVDPSLRKITIDSQSFATANSVSVSGTASIGLSDGASVADSSATSEASSTGIDGGLGNDTIDNIMEIAATSLADATANSTSVTVGISVGASGSASLGDASATARSDATGIEGGEEDDTIVNIATITAGVANDNPDPMAQAQAGSTSVVVGIAAGYTNREASANSSAFAEANAAGISGGSGDDWIENSGAITVGPDPEGTGGMANASGASTAVNVGLTVGESLGKTSSDTSSTAVANLAGIRGGSGNDTVYNSGSITVGRYFSDSEEPEEAMATAHAASETVDVSITVGDSLSEASSNASATAQSISIGIETGAGIDFIENDGIDDDHTGVINVFSSSEAVGLGKTTTASLTVGASDSSAQSNASSLSTALATGIDGGGDADEITSDSDVVVKALAISETLSQSTNYNILSLGSALQSADANSSSTAEAIARGIDGGTGLDTITVAGNYEVSADTRVKSTSRSSTVTGVSIGLNVQEAQSRAGTVSDALAIGIDGGEGNDVINSTANLTVTTHSNAETTATSSSNTGLNIAGSSSAESVAGATSDVTASGIGIRGGISVLDADETDVDVITNEGVITVTTSVTAATNSTSTADSITIFGEAEGAAMSDASATVLADGTGIDGGADNDTITSENTITVTTTADASVTSTSNVDSYATFGGASSMGVSDASANVLAEATGISGGTGDDIITSRALIAVDAQSIGSVTATSDVDAEVTFGGASSEAASNASVTKKGSATGIDGGDGGDVITNYDELYVEATSSGTVTSESKAAASTFIGNTSSVTSAAASLEGTVDTKGIIGGSGGDTITNLGRVDSIANAALFVETSSVATAKSRFIGNADARASSVSTLQGMASSLGVSGDDGDDVIENDGVVNASAIANANVESSTVAIAESFFGSSYTEASSSNYAAGVSTAEGITTGAGIDQIVNSELITVETGGEVTIESEVYSSDGPASSDARTMALSQASGIDSGADGDNITNTATVFVKAAPRITSATRTFGSSGNVNGKVGILLDAGATGITGGEGNDTISNGGNVLVFIGAPETESTVSKEATSGEKAVTDNNRIEEDTEAIVGKWIRIAGGENPDFFTEIVDFDTTSGEMTLRDALVYDLPSGTTYTICDYGDKGVDITEVTTTVGGRTRVDASTTALVQAKGIVGGDGDDEIVNSGTTTVSASNLIKAIKLTLGRNIVVDTRIESSVNAVGIEGNDESWVTDVSDGETNLFTDLSRKGEDPEAIVGKPVLFKSGASADFVTFVEAFDPDTGAFTLADPLPAGGLSRGDIYTIGRGSDIISNLGTIDVGAKSAIDASSWSLDFGAADIEAQGQTLAASAGMRSGQFDDSLQNYGDISTRSAADVSSSDRVYVVFGRADQDLSFEASSHSVGVEMGAGNDDFTNAENSSVYTEAVSTASVDGVTAVIFAKITNSVDAIADSTAMGLDLGQGNNVAYNWGDILTTSQATVVANAVSVYELGETDADADAVASGAAWGIRSGSNEDQVYNGALIQVEALTDATSFAQGSQVGNRDMISEVTGGSEGDSDPSTFVDASLIPPPGEQVEILGEWVRFITGDNADENFFAQVVGFVYEDIVDPDTGDVTVPAGTVILSRDIPHPVYAEVVDDDTGEVIIEADEYTFSAARNGTSASVATSDATGIDLRNSEAIIDNTGTLEVTAFAKAKTTANTYGGAATADAEATAEARGIRTGDGDDVITNTGDIDVTAEVTTESNTGVTEERALAIGIETGDGDDIIINSGSIVTSVEDGGSSGRGVGVAAGGGSDQLFLIENSSVDGSVDLGAGDDAMTFSNSAVLNGDITGGPDVDSLIIADENTFTVSPLAEMEQFYLNHGTLEINGHQNLVPDASVGLLKTEINYLGQYTGLLRVNGDTGLDGTVEVIASPYAYMDGDTFDIVEATNIVGLFETEMLPNPTPLLDFDLNYLNDPDVVQVEVSVESFTTVATDSVGMAIAKYLDRVTPTATGDLSNIIGEFQLLSPSEFGAAFASLSPGLYDNSTRTMYDTTRRYTTTLLKRIHSVQLMSAQTVSQNNDASGVEENLLAYNGSAASIGRLFVPAQQKQPKKYGIWLDGFGQWGDRDEDDGFTGYDYTVHGVTLGIDHMFRDRYIAGISIGYSDTDVDVDRDQGDGDIDTLYGSLYGSYYTRRGYIDAVLSYGNQDYYNKRRVVIGPIEREARSDHDGDMFSAFAEGGYNIDVNTWALQPFASLHYLSLDEEGFAERGADSANLIVDNRETESLVSELGLRITRLYELERGTLIPEVSLAWNYDFDIDDRTITTAFAGAPTSSFSMEGQAVEKNGMTIGTGITLMNKCGLTTSLKYNAEFRDGFGSHGLIGELRYEF